MKKEILTVSGPKLAQILGISDRRIRALESEGVVTKLDRGKYDLVNSVRSYINYQIELVKSRQATGTLLEEQTRLTKLKADTAALELDLLQAESIPVGEVVSLWQHIVTAARTRMLAIHSTVKTKHPDLDLGIVASMEELIRECMEDMSHDGLPERYRKSVERNGKAVDAAS